MIETKKYNEFIATHDVLEKKNTKKFKRYVYTLGYLDGLYGELEYKRYVPEDRECKILYSEGYGEGVNDNIKKTSKIPFTKSVWITKLAVSDYKNSFNDRHLSEEAQEFYDLNYNDLMLVCGDENITDEDYAEAEKLWDKNKKQL